MMAYDARDGYELLVGDGSTWRDSPVGWVELHPTVQPSNRTFASLVFDPTAGDTVLFGGMPAWPWCSGACSPLNDTWTYQGGNWTRLNLTNAPPPSEGAVMTFDSTDGYLLLFDGVNHPFTWKFSDGSWTNLTWSAGPGPSQRYGATLVDDPRDGSVLLFGGSSWGPNGCGPCYPPQEFNDTWSFSAGIWENLTPSLAASPSPRDSAVAGYDAVDGYVVLFGGFRTSAGGNGPSDAWTFSADHWNPVNRSAGLPWPNIQYDAVTAFDEAKESLVVYGGVSSDGAPCSTAWGYISKNWTAIPGFQPVPVPESADGSPDAMTYDAADGYVLLFGDGDPTVPATWTFAAGRWTELYPSVSPPARWGGSMAYDPSDGFVVLFGGSGADSLLNDTWSFSSGVWTNLTGTTGSAPAARWGAALTYDSEDGYLLLFGGFQPSSFDILGRNDTWSFHAGVWTNRTAPGPAPAIRYFGSLADDPTDGYVVLFGGTYGCDGWCSNWAFYNDTWTYHAGSWNQMHPSSIPPGREGALLALDPTSGDVVLFGGDSYGGSAFSDTWLYHGGNWTRVNATFHPIGLIDPSYATDLADRSVLMFGGWNGTWSPAASAWYFQTTAFHASISAIPESGTAPLSVALNVSSNGGTLPLAANWTFGDGTTGSGLAVLHRFAAPGVYFARVNVTDARGNWTGANVELTVGSNLTAYAFANQTSGTSPLSVSFSGETFGGIPPYAVSWTFGDGSSASSGSGGLHEYAQPGEYRAVFTVRDGLNSTATSAIEVDSVIEPLTVSMSASALEGDAPLAVAFNATPSGGSPGYSYLWSFGDGSNATTRSPIHLFTSPGAFDVSVGAIDSHGRRTEQNLTIQVLPAPTVLGSVGPMSGTAPLLVEVGGEIHGGAAPYVVQWSFGDGSYAIQLNASHVYYAAGQYSLAVVVTDKFGATASDGPWTVNVSASLPGLTASVDVYPVPVLLGAEVNLSAVPEWGVAPYSYSWSDLPPNCTNLDLARLTCTPTTVGTFEPQVSISDASGDRAVATSTLVVLAPTLRVTMTVSPVAVSIGGLAYLSVDVSGGVPPLRSGWDLPKWCQVGTSWDATCMPEAAGTYVDVAGFVVVDAVGQAAWANATIVVESVSVPATQTPPPPGLTPAEAAALGAGLGGAAAAVLLFFLMRRRTGTP